MAEFLALNPTYHKHKELCPKSQLSKRAIKLAIESGELPVIKVGNRNLINWEVFERWTRGELLNG